MWLGRQKASLNRGSAYFGEPAASECADARMCVPRTGLWKSDKGAVFKEDLRFSFVIVETQLDGRASTDEGHLEVSSRPQKISNFSVGHPLVSKSAPSATQTTLASFLDVAPSAAAVPWLDVLTFRKNSHHKRDCSHRETLCIETDSRPDLTNSEGWSICPTIFEVLRKFVQSV